MGFLLSAVAPLLRNHSDVKTDSWRPAGSVQIVQVPFAMAFPPVAPCSLGFYSITIAKAF